MEVEVYNCGCKLRFTKVDDSEFEDDLPERPALVQDFIPCIKHKHIREIPPRGARLITVRGEHEKFLNE